MSNASVPLEQLMVCFTWANSESFASSSPTSGPHDVLTVLQNPVDRTAHLILDDTELCL